MYISNLDTSLSGCREQFTAAAQTVPEQDDWPLCEYDENHGKSEWKCLQCGDYMCAACTNMHKKGRKSRHHRLLSKDEKSEEEKLMKELFCNIHTGRELDMYCKDDQKAICIECSMKSHTNHDVITMDDLADEKRSLVGKSLVTVDIAIPKYLSFIQKLDAHILEAEKRKSTNCQIIDLVAKKAINKIKEKSTKLKTAEEDKFRLLKQSATTRKEAFQETKQELEKVALKSRRFLETCNNRTLIDQATQHIDSLSFKQPDDLALQVVPELDSCDVENNLMN